MLVKRGETTVCGEKGMTVPPPFRDWVTRKYALTVIQPGTVCFFETDPTNVELLSDPTDVQEQIQ